MFEVTRLFASLGLLFVVQLSGNVADGSDSWATYDANSADCDGITSVAWESPSREPCPSGLFDELTFFGGIDGSKQPQDFGGNANLGGQVNANWGIPLVSQFGIGLQLGTGFVLSDNAVQVFELVGEATDRWQHYTTIGLYQRHDVYAWGVSYDHLYEESYDNFSLGQVRLGASILLTPHLETGITTRIATSSDQGAFGTTNVSLKPINQGSIYLRKFWETGVQSTCYFGIADGHGENNVIVGAAPDFGNSFVLGADFLAPLSDHLALYGETNLIMPSDTGVVDAFLGFQFYPSGGAKCGRRTPYAPFFNVAAPTSFSVDLRQ